MDNRTLGTFTMPVSFTVPLDMPCAKCGKEGAEHDERTVIISAGSAWQDGAAVLEDGAELYTAQVFCKEHTPATTTAG